MSKRAGLLTCAAAMGLIVVSNPLAADLVVDFSWSGIERCSTESPEITVTNVPPGAATFEVNLKDLDAPSFHHGGGTVPADPTGKIPRGSLHSYTGPCPPFGSHTYEFTVIAHDASGNQLGVGAKSAAFPP